MKRLLCSAVENPAKFHWHHVLFDSRELLVSLHKKSKEVFSTCDIVREKKSILLQLAGMPLHNQLMDLPPCRKCSHSESGAVKFHLKFFTVLLQLMFLLWLVLPYLCLIVLSSTIATVSFPCCDSFQSAPFPKDRKKIPFSSNPPLFYKPLFQVCFINNTNTTQSWKISCPCPACLIEPDHPQGQEVYLCIFFELLSA